MKKIIAYLFVLSLILILWACDKVANPQYHVDVTSCNSCGECIQVCPVDAIDFGSDGKAVIDQTKCNQCGECMTVCPKDAVY